MYISNEIPQGTVDGSNKIFTSNYNIDTVDTIWVDGAPYFDYTTNNQTITLTDAPTSSIRINYYTEPTSGNSEYFTVGEARNILERNIDDDLPEVSSQLFLDWINELNRFTFRKLYRVDSSQFRQYGLFNVEKDIANYTLPSDFRDITVTGTGFYKVDSNGDATSQKLKPTGIGASEEGYYLEGNNSVVFTPKPSNDTTYWLYYIPKLQELTSDDQNTVINKEYQSYLIKALKITYYDFINDQGNEVFTDQKFERLLNEYIEYFRKSPKVYQTLNIITSY